MKNKKLIFPILISGALLFSCNQKEISSSKPISKSAKLDSVAGIVSVVGNEPFTKLALEVNDSTSFILDCDSLTKSELLKNQGNRFLIKYSETDSSYEGTKLKVKKFYPIIDNEQ